MKLKIFSCSEHDHTVTYLDDQLVTSNDYSIENVLRFAEHLGWELEEVELPPAEFEAKFA
jgi:hypothetical protein